MVCKAHEMPLPAHKDDIESPESSSENLVI
jgi:hypothetical protein